MFLHKHLHWAQRLSFSNTVHQVLCHNQAATCQTVRDTCAKHEASNRRVDTPVDTVWPSCVDLQLLCVWCISESSQRRTTKGKTDPRRVRAGATGQWQWCQHFSTVVWTTVLIYPYKMPQFCSDGCHRTCSGTTESVEEINSQSHRHKPHKPLLMQSSLHTSQCLLFIFSNGRNWGLSLNCPFHLPHKRKNISHTWSDWKCKPQRINKHLDARPGASCLSWKEW